MSFIEVEHNVDQLGLVVDVLARDGCKVDIALRTVNLLEVFKSLADQFAIEDLALLHPKHAQQDFLVE